MINSRLIKKIATQVAQGMPNYPWAEPYQYQISFLELCLSELKKQQEPVETCTCPSGDGSLRWPCRQHPPIQPDPVLDKPAMVGRGRFGVGVKWGTVIGAAQRLYEYEVTPSKEKVRIKLAQDAMDDLRQFVGVAAADVLAERKRQLEVEGWTPEHDDEHGAGELGRAGGFYALNAGAALHFGTTDTSICDQAPSGWPWAPEWWKPKNSRHDLVKAGALILAEIERLDRASMAASKEDSDAGH